MSIFSLDALPHFRSPSVRGSGDDAPAADPSRPQSSIFDAHRQVEHANRYQYLPRYGVLV